MGALPLNARVAHFRLIFWRRESGITRVRAGKVDWLRRVWTQRSHVHSVGLEVEDLLAGVNGIRRHPHRRRGCVPVPGSQGPMSRRLYSGAEAMCSSAGPVRGGRMDAFMERMQVVVSGFMHLWLPTQPGALAGDQRTCVERWPVARCCCGRRVAMRRCWRVGGGAGAQFHHGARQRDA